MREGLPQLQASALAQKSASVGLAKVFHFSSWLVMGLEKMGKLSKIVPSFDFSPISCQFHTFFMHFPKCIFGNFSQFPIFPHSHHFPLFPPIFHIFLHFPPFPPISPHFFHFPKPLRRAANVAAANVKACNCCGEAPPNGHWRAQPPTGGVVHRRPCPRPLRRPAQRQHRDFGDEGTLPAPWRMAPTTASVTAPSSRRRSADVVWGREEAPRPWHGPGRGPGGPGHEATVALPRH